MGLGVLEDTKLEHVPGPQLCNCYDVIAWSDWTC